MIKANLPWIESPFFAEILESKNLSPAQKAIATDYNRDGFVVLKDFFPVELIDQARKEVEEIGFNPKMAVKLRDQQRIQDFWTMADGVKKIAADQGIKDILEMLYGREPIPFQTLNFCKGSEQRAHSDTIHFSSLPAKFMCGVWVALEDITDENGPLFYYPGSHRLPEYNFSQIRDNAKATSYENYKEYEDFIEEIVKVNHYEKKVFHAKKGDALIWSSNILHGGSPVLKEGSSRWSQVTHYFFKDCYYYTPMLSNMVTDELYLRNKLIDISTGLKVIPSYNGEKLAYIKTNKNQYIINNNINGTKNAFRLFFMNLFRKRQ